jgi:hypothetical protein
VSRDAPLADRPSSSASPVVPSIIVIVAALLALWPLARADFTLWDDPFTVVQNPHVNPPTIEGLKFHWTHAWQELYVPVTYTAWWLIATVARVPGAAGGGAASLNPWIFHSANLLVHIASSLLVLSVLRRLLGARATWAACAGAVLFAVHPVQVETVAWASGLKDLLCGMFSLLAVDRYVGALAPSPGTRGEGRGEGPSDSAYGVAIAAFVAAELSKPTAVAVPLILFVIDVLLLNRPMRSVLRSIFPFALLALPCMVWTKLAQPSTLIAPIPLWWRPFVAGDAMAFYLLKLIAPLHLAIDYGRTPASVMANRMALVTWIVPIVIAAILWRLRWKDLFAAFGVFVAALLPVLGLVPFEFQARSTVGDHYLYLPMLGVSLAFAAVLSRISWRVATVAAPVVLVVLGVRSWFATWHWQDSTTLFTHTLDVNPRSAIAENNLLILAMEAGRGDEAVRRATRLKELAPDDPVTWFNLGSALATAHRYEEAADVYRAAIGRWPQRVEGYGGLAAALIDLKRPAEALEQYDAALRIEPRNATMIELRRQAAQKLAATQATQPSTR